METNASEILNSMLCFSLYTCSREMTRAYRPLLDRLQITYPQYLVLLLLWGHSPRSVKDIGEELLLDSGTLTPLLKRLEEKGWVTKSRLKTDERVVQVSLTDAGKSLQTGASCIPDALMERIGFNETDYKALLTQLHALLERLQRIDSEEQK